MSTQPIKAKPVVKWVGGKSKLVQEILKRFPQEFNDYHEPFAGGAAVFFALGHQRSTLYDINNKLMALYEVLKSDSSNLFREVKNLEMDFNCLDLTSRRLWFAELRQKFNAGDSSDLIQSAMFVALNKTAFNGLYRENAKGQFNVPFNQARHQVSFGDEPNFRLAADCLAQAQLVQSGFQEVEERASKGDLVYFDPPYVPLTPTSSFTGYHSSGFGEKQQLELLELCVRLRSKGVHILSSNSYSEWVRAKYEDAGFQVLPVTVNRGIAAKASSRAKISEALIV